MEQGARKLKILDTYLCIFQWLWVHIYGDGERESTVFSDALFSCEKF